jgi:hypothetical protein
MGADRIDPVKRLPWYCDSPDLHAAVEQQRRRQSPTPSRRHPHGNSSSRADGITYVIGAADQSVVKIGRTTGDARARLSAMQTGSPVTLLLLCSLPHPRWEDVLHAHFADMRQQGEWFALELDDVAAIMRWACQAAGIESAWPSDDDALSAGWDSTSSAIEGVYGSRAVRAWLNSTDSDS